ncbi:hypothetical protein PR202_gb25178 [Eleusine coracana subsp. coracana]|uniref:Kinetochore protein SPC25 n=1 Tax=Eleusine coracana subsp. coracana TaxID=191504 RepID=A0AAV5FKX2_ELECO|nr:hypothetical protein PR202_gb25178 [Eleusine coracana subsp. coracana]
MASFDEKTESLRQQIASGAARLKAAPPPDPRRKEMEDRKAAYKERLAAHRDRVSVPDPALAAALSLAEQTLARQEQLQALKKQHRDLESQSHQALSIKSHKEAEYRCITESISDATARNENLNRSLVKLRNKRDTLAAVISYQLQDLETCEEEINENATEMENIESGLSWFNKVLGLKIIHGEEKEYSFCMRIDNGTYNSVVQSDPPIKDSEELVKDLNLTQDICKFLKVVREEFQASSVNGNLPLSSVACPVVPSVPFSPPVTTTVNCTSEDVPSQSNSRSKNKSLPAKRSRTDPSPGLCVALHVYLRQVSVILSGYTLS